MYPENGRSENKILDLTSQEDEEVDPDYICEHCELPMRKPSEDLSAVDGTIVVKEGSYYCNKCGMVWDPQDQQQQRVMKSQEKTGPRIPKSDSNDFFFESIPSNSGLEPKHIEGFDR
jgi:hypothetical protein